MSNPSDYSYVNTVREGEALRRSQPIHESPNPSSPAVRYRAERRRQAGAAAAAAPGADDYGIPDNPFVKPQAASAQSIQPGTQPARTGTEERAIPEWLRVAQQNNLPSGGHSFRETPSRTFEEYELDGYPSSVVNEFRINEGSDITPFRKRHGAQLALSRGAEPATPRDPQRPVRAEAGSESIPAYSSEGAEGLPWQKPTVQASLSPYSPYGSPTSSAENSLAARMRSASASSGTMASDGHSLASRLQSVQTGSSTGANGAYLRSAPSQLPKASAPKPFPQDEYRVDSSEEKPASSSTLPVILGAFALVAASILLVLWAQAQAGLMSLEKQRKAERDALKTAHPLKYQELIQQKAFKYNLSPAFVSAVMLNESSFNPEAVSNVGARGLMQLMDDTAQWIWGKMKLEGTYSFDSLYSPDTNAEFGCWYLNYLSKLFNGDPVLVAAAFHAGQGTVSNWLSEYSSDGRTISLGKLPDGPTKTYVTRIMRDYAVYLDLMSSQKEDSV